MADNLKLKNPETAAQFDTVEPRDYRVLVPGVYKGLLSEIPPAAAQLIVEQQGYKRLVKKEPAAAAPAASKQAKDKA